MSLNKHDLDTFRRAKRLRAQRIDMLILVLFLLVSIFLTLDRPIPGPGDPAFHKAEAKAVVEDKVVEPVIAHAPN